jgi:hypothetical protein
MNIAALHQKLIAAARLQPPDDRVPYAYERRIMALVSEHAAVSNRLLWARGLWRAAASCLALAAVCGAITFFMPVNVDSSNDLSQEFENTLLASIDQADTSP